MHAGLLLAVAASAAAIDPQFRRGPDLLDDAKRASLDPPRPRERPAPRRIVMIEPKPPPGPRMNGAREVARRLRQAERAAAKAAKRRP